MPGEFREAEPLHDCFHLCSDLFFVPSQARADVLLGVHVWKKRVILEKITDPAFPGRYIDSGAAVKQDPVSQLNPTLIRRQDPGKRLQRHGFSAARCAQYSISPVRNIHLCLQRKISRADTERRLHFHSCSPRPASLLCEMCPIAARTISAMTIMTVTQTPAVR